MALEFESQFSVISEDPETFSLIAECVITVASLGLTRKFRVVYEPDKQEATIWKDNFLFVRLTGRTMFSEVQTMPKSQKLVSLIVFDKLMKHQDTPLPGLMPPVMTDDAMREAFLVALQ